MLIQFSVENFQCFKEKVTLDMTAYKGLSEFKDNLINNNYLPLATIYGPNGGGKTTVIKAFSALQKLLLNSVGGFPFNVPLDILPFKFDSISINNPTEFEIVLLINNKEYFYKISIFKGEITYESLFEKENKVRKKLVFVRNKNDIKINTTYIKSSIKLPAPAIGMPYLIFLYRFVDIYPIKQVVDWFRNTYCVDYNEPIIEDFLLLNIYQMGKDKDAKIKKKQFLNLCKKMGLNIDDYDIKILENNHSFQVNTYHFVDNKKYDLNLKFESNGTKKLFGLFPLFIKALTEGKTIFIDELDAKLHPSIVQEIVKLFRDKNTNPLGAQLIFTSHDVNAMTSKLFRRDEIWFVAMNKKQYSNLYSLVEIREENGEIVRKDKVYSKRYLEGYFGAEPLLNRVKGWYKTNE